MYLSFTYSEEFGYFFYYYYVKRGKVKSPTSKLE